MINKNKKFFNLTFKKFQKTIKVTVPYSGNQASFCWSEMMHKYLHNFEDGVLISSIQCLESPLYFFIVSDKVTTYHIGAHLGACAYE